MSAKQLAASAFTAERVGLHEVAQDYLQLLALQVFHRFNVTILMHGYNSLCYIVQGSRDEHPLLLTENA